MNDELFAALAISLVLTLILEIGFFLFIGKRNKKDLLLVGLVNVITNPAVVLLYWAAVLYTDLNLILVTMVIELWAIVTEGYYYKTRGQDFGHPYFFSIAANAFSFGTGVLLQQFNLI